MSTEQPKRPRGRPRYVSPDERLVPITIAVPPAVRDWIKRQTPTAVRAALVKISASDS